MINRCDYLFNLYEIFLQVESRYRNYIIFEKIVTTCFPFELNYAKSQLEEMKNSNVFSSGMIIDDIIIDSFNINELKEDSNIKLVTESRKEFTVKAKEINWYLGTSLLSFFESPDFMICFTYEALLNKNYLKLEENINNTFT